jgi:hypothetical protein
VRTDQPHPSPASSDAEIERVSAELKAQARNAKERIRERYGKLMEARSFAPHDRNETPP